MLTDGYVKLWRSLLDHPLITQLPATVFKIFAISLMRANFQPTKWYDGAKQVDIPAGAFIFSQESLAKTCHSTRDQVRTALRHLQNLGIITIGTTNRYSLLIIEKWYIYQSTEHTLPQRVPHQIPSRPPTDPQQIPTEEESKKERREEHTQRARVLASDLNGQASQKWEEFLGKYPIKANLDAACRAFMSYVTVENESKVFACLDRYLQSERVSRGIVMNPDNWLLQQHRDNWQADWPRTERTESNGLPPPKRWVEPPDDIPPSRPLPLPPELMERLNKGKG